MIVWLCSTNADMCFYAPRVRARAVARFLLTNSPSPHHLFHRSLPRFPPSFTALHEVCSRGATSCVAPIVARLSAEGLNRKNTQKKNPIHLAIQYNNHQTAIAIINAGSTDWRTGEKSDFSKVDIMELRRTWVTEAKEARKEAGLADDGSWQRALVAGKEQETFDGVPGMSNFLW